MPLVVKNTFTHHSVEGGIICILADSPTEPVPGQARIRMVSEDAFDAGTPERAYAKAYGILVWPDNLRERADTEVGTFLQWTLHEDADGAWATRQYPYGKVTARRVDQLFDLIEDYEED